MLPIRFQYVFIFGGADADWIRNPLIALKANL